LHHILDAFVGQDVILRGVVNAARWADFQKKAEG
jgi:hypothetical protein